MKIFSIRVFSARQTAAEALPSWYWRSLDIIESTRPEKNSAPSSCNYKNKVKTHTLKQRGQALELVTFVHARTSFMLAVDTQLTTRARQHIHQSTYPSFTIKFNPSPNPTPIQHFFPQDISSRVQNSLENDRCLYVENARGIE